MLGKEKELKLIITVYNTTAAIKMEKEFQTEGIPGRLIPVPRQISAGCGLSWMTDVTEREIIEKKIHELGLEVQGLHEIML
ncbi:MAG: DUF3343 domain-containing protein [Lachnospiraceae bacterium]|jgi:hypothetical protein|nr:DUF3343 domain-containing protein [Lachnospiraceae bacterium]